MSDTAVSKSSPDFMSVARGLLRTMRPRQWAKSFPVLAGIVFDQQLLDGNAFIRVIAAFWLFSFTASTVYIINDIVDIERDRLHPKKQLRPLPSGQLPIRVALIAAVIFPVLTIGASPGPRAPATEPVTKRSPCSHR